MHESGENYLETILILEKKGNLVRAIDVANELGYSKASVSRGVALLKKENCITVNKSGILQLTEEGRLIAERVFERHVMLTRFFVEYAEVSEAIAEKDACKVEHILSEETYQGLKRHVK